MDINGLVSVYVIFLPSYSIFEGSTSVNSLSAPQERGVIKSRNRIGLTTAHNNLTAHPKPHAIWNLSLAVVLSIVILFVVI